ncbi:hypothetical protein MMC20_002439 [Loxospora ochrophaea]|nr:hypothetical protein [Loxospora ochrophaea]
MANNSSAQIQDVSDPLRAHFEGPVLDHQSRWSKLWDVGDFLPWDRGTPNPALIDVLSERHALIGNCFVEDGAGGKRRKRALVPGCGAGYDVLLLASFGYESYGLEISESAVRKCEDEKKRNSHRYPTRVATVGMGASTFLRGDFFGEEWSKELEGGGKFELIYDYTFLSALPPALRPLWSLRHSQLLNSEPSSNLICIEFPTYKEPSAGGPPFACPPKAYLEHLSHPGEAPSYDDNGHVKENILRRPSLGGLERVAHWQPERTHEIGKGTDWISIWRHC